MLTRVKTFVATGLATAGRLYAGDLNQIQDAVAAYSDYSQRVDVATLGIGETALALLRYGTGEARLTGALRTDGVLRGLGGVFAGTFTTAQRNAIPSGQAPYGLIILNTDNNRFEWNRGSDASRNWVPFTITVERNGASPVSEAGINFIQGSGMTITVTDNPGTGYVDVTLAATAQTIGGTIPIGGSIEWNGASDPPNYLIEDGRSLVRVAPYDQLFAVIGTQFGAADGTHFNIPDSRGRVAVGVNAKHVLGGNEGLAVGSRSTSHHHNYQMPGAQHGGYTQAGNAPDDSIPAQSTSGDTANTDTPAWIGKNKAIRYQ